MTGSFEKGGKLYLNTRRRRCAPSIARTHRLQDNFAAAAAADGRQACECFTVLPSEHQAALNSQRSINDQQTVFRNAAATMLCQSPSAQLAAARTCQTAQCRSSQSKRTTLTMAPAPAAGSTW